MSHSIYKKNNYRPDIDGLRAIAVIFVIGFHVFPIFFKNGFIGVDIFFVISGYLISNIIFDKIRSNSFSFLEFYSRRINRILPALLLVLISTYILGWFFLYPEELKELSREIIGAITFTSNNKFLKEIGYFDLAADTKPLLHLWSLSIEEQFYILWPLILWVTHRKKNGWLFVTLCFGLASFIFHIITIQINRDEAFYLSYLRFWEILAGCLTSYLYAFSTKFNSKRTKWLSIFHPHINNIKFIGGLLLIILGVLFIQENSAYPGWPALLSPVFGTILLLTSKSKLKNTILANKILVYIGLISYPLYLWHWPILVLSKIFSGKELLLTEKIYLLIITFALASATYHFIEKPIRRKKSNPITLFLVLILLVIGAFAFMTKKQNGFIDRPFVTQKNILDLNYMDFRKGVEDQNYSQCNFLNVKNNFVTTYCLRGNEKIINAALIGDSHAADKFYGLVKNDSINNWVLIAQLSCPPLYAVNVEKDVKNCQGISESYIDWLVKEKNIKTVAISFYGNYFLTKSYAADHIKSKFGLEKVKIEAHGDLANKTREEIFYEGLNLTIKKLISANKKVVLFVDVPELPFMPIDCFRSPLANNCSITKEQVLERQEALRKIILKLKNENKNIGIFDPLNVMCEKYTCSFFKGKDILYKDSNHLTLKGSDLLGNAFIKAFIN